MTTALLLVDVQQNMLDGEAPVPVAATVAPVLADLLARARGARVPVVHVQNDGGEGDPDLPGTPGWELVFPPEPSETVVRKTQWNTLASNPGLAGELRERGVTRVVVAGMQSEYCVRATGLGLLGEGFGVVLAHGGHATYDDDRPAAQISAAVETELGAAGVAVLPAADIDFEG